MILVCIITVVLAVTVLAGTGSGASESSAFDQLLAMKDQLPLSGLQPLHLDSRKNIEKALPKHQKRNLTIGWTGASLGSTFFTEMMSSANVAAKKYNYKMLYQNANFDIQKQYTHIDTFISQKVDVLVVNAVDMAATLQYYKRAVAAGIPVIVTGPTAGKPDYPIVTTFLSGSYEPGFQVGLYTAKKMWKAGHVLKVGFTESDLGYADANSRPCGFIGGYLYQSHIMAGKPYASKWDAALEGYNDWIKVKDQGKFNDTANDLDFVGYGVGGGTDPASGQKAASDLLTAHPDINVLVVEEDSQFRGVIKEIQQHNLVPGKDIILVAPADATKEGMEYVKNGTVLAVASNCPYYDGEAVINLIHRIFEENFDATNLPVNSYTPTACITKENLAQFYDPKVAFAKALPWKVQTIDEYNAANAKK